MMKTAFYDGITEFIFVENQPQKADVILPSGRSISGGGTLCGEAVSGMLCAAGAAVRKIQYHEGDALNVATGS